VFRGVDTVHQTPCLTPGIDVLQCCSATAHGLSRRDSKYVWLLEKIFAKRQHCAVVISAGGIDCRSHIVRKAEEHGVSIEDEAASVARRMHAAVKAASAYGNAPFVYLTPIASCANVRYAHWGVSGTLQERNRATMAFRDALMECAPVIDTLDITMNPDFTTRTDALFDPIHLSARHLPTLLDRLRAALRSVGVEWAETGGGDFKLAQRGDRPGVKAHGSHEQPSPSA